MIIHIFAIKNQFFVVYYLKKTTNCVIINLYINLRVITALKKCTSKHILSVVSDNSYAVQTVYFAVLRHRGALRRINERSNFYTF